jgi:hypothetical protein
MQTVSKSNKSGYESLLKIYRETDLSQEKVRVLGNLIFPFHQKIGWKPVEITSAKEGWGAENVQRKGTSSGNRRRQRN